MTIAMMMMMMMILVSSKPVGLKNSLLNTTKSSGNESVRNVTFSVRSHVKAAI